MRHSMNYNADSDKYIIREKINGRSQPNIFREEKLSPALLYAALLTHIHYLINLKKECPV